MRCTVAELSERMTAAEFGQWQVFLQHEPLDDASRLQLWAQLMAAVSNGALTKRDKTLFTWRDFLGTPWAAKPEAEAGSAPSLQGLQQWLSN